MQCNDTSPIATQREDGGFGPRTDGHAGETAPNWRRMEPPRLGTFYRVQAPKGTFQRLYLGPDLLETHAAAWNARGMDA